MPTFPKLKIGQNLKREYFDMSHDVNTTCDFGFCQPTLGQDLIPNTRFKLQTKAFIRLAPLPVPTFSRIKYKQITRCIKMTDLMPDFKHFLSQRKQVNSNHILPLNITSVDYIWFADLLCTMQRIMVNNCFNADICDGSYSNLELVDTNDLFYRLSLWTNGPVNEDDAQGAAGEFAGFYYDVFNSANNGFAGSLNTAYNQLSALLGTENSPGVISTNSFFRKFGINDYYPYFASDTDYYAGNDNAPFRTTLLQWLSIKHFTGASSFADHESVNPLLGSYLQYAYCNNESGVPESLHSIFDQPMTLDNADFIVDFGTFDPVTYNLITRNNQVREKSITSCKVGIHLTPAGRRLMKILYAFGVNTYNKADNFPMYKLLAYYKTWFDSFNVGRLKSWETTNAYGLIDAFHETHRNVHEVLHTLTDGYDLVAENVHTFVQGFVQDLVRCCYVLPADQYTCCNENSPLYTESSDNHLLHGGLYHSGTSTGMGVLSLSNTNYGREQFNFVDSLTVQALQRLYPYINKYSVFGNKVDEYLRAKYGISLQRGSFVGESDFMLNVDDVFSTAETSEGYLGEYAGKGIGSGQSKDMVYECDDDFYFLVQITCIVPLGGYSQGAFNHMITPSDFYQDIFDSLGMEAVKSGNIIGRSYCTKFNNDLTTVFGFRPRFTFLKYHDNLANGGFAFRGQMSQFLPYMLDRHFTSADLKSYYGVDSRYPHAYYVRENDSVKVRPNEEMRYIGLNEAFGNYDRIFVDTTGTTDNFILTLYQKFDMYAPMKSISESYETFDKDNDTSVIKTEKS